MAILLNEGSEIQTRVNQAGYRYFTNLEDFSEYVQREILALEPDAV